MASTMHLDESGTSKTYRFVQISAQLCCIWAGECWAPPLTHKVWVPQVSESGTPLGLRGTLNEFVCGKVSIFQNGEEKHLESNQSRNIHFGLISDAEFCATISWNEHREDPEQVVWNFQTTYQEHWKIALTMKNGFKDASRWIRNVKNIQICTNFSPTLLHLGRRVLSTPTHTQRVSATSMRRGI